MPTVDKLALVPYHRFVKFPFKNTNLNVEHIKCVTFAIGNALVDSDLASEWLIYNIQLIRSVSTIYACEELGKYSKYM